VQTLAQGLPVVEQLSLAYNELSDLEVRNHIRGQGGEREEEEELGYYV